MRLLLLVLWAGMAWGQAIDVYLIGGQSNATGQGYVKNLPKRFFPNPRVLLFHSGRPHLDSGEPAMVWAGLRQASESPDRFGLELGFGNRIAELEGKRKIALIKHAHSGTNLYAQWNPGKDKDDTAHWGSQFQAFVETVEAGMKDLRAQGYTPRLRGMIWQQGESDQSGNASAEYGANLAHFIARVREQFAVPELVFVYGYVLPPPNSGAGREAVRAGQRAVDEGSGSPLAVRRAYVVATDDLSQRADDAASPYPHDHVHFGTAGTLELGRRMADEMARRVKSN